MKKVVKKEKVEYLGEEVEEEEEKEVEREDVKVGRSQIV